MKLGFSLLSLLPMLGIVAGREGQHRLTKHVDQRGMFEVYEYPSGVRVGCLNVNGSATSNNSTCAEFMCTFREWRGDTSQTARNGTIGGYNYTLSSTSGFCGVLGDSEVGTFGCSHKMPFNHTVAGGMGGYSGMNFSIGTNHALTNLSILVAESWPCRGVWSPGFPLSISAEPMDLNAGECDSSRGKQSYFSIVPSFRPAP